MNIGQIYTFISQQVIFIWLLVFVTPLYIFIASILAKGIQLLYKMSINRESIIYTYIGDLSWLFPFKQNEQEFKLIHTMFLAILIAIASLIILGGVLMLNLLEQKKMQQDKIEQKQRQKIEKRENK
ncbi:unnamed protein product [Paramecium sonneborni]|uniref:Uncharacterized protein n=1 Tax=Paramecium sonneborni TaxID=65129 RepID=A0A8S1MHS1_9CILI|nr:unnamed protein product [Paramecium sonneborni]